MDVYIQKIKGEFHNVNPYIAWKGFVERGAYVQFFESSELASLPISPETPVVGGIPVVQRALRQLGCAVPEMNAIPQALQPFAGREISQLTLGQVRARIEAGGPPLFIKPLPGDHKLFNGHVVSAFRDLIETAGVEPTTPVSCSEVVEFVSEYRGYVHQKSLVGFKHYRGDFRVFPNFGPIEAAIESWTNQPIACSMDWGVTRDGRTLLVEVNDAYSLGSYGLDPLVYAPMLADRWFEMTGSSSRA